MPRSTKAEHCIIGSGAAFGIAVVLTSMPSDDFQEGGISDSTSVVAIPARAALGLRGRYAWPRIGIFISEWCGPNA